MTDYCTKTCFVIPLEEEQAREALAIMQDFENCLEQRRAGEEMTPLCPETAALIDLADESFETLGVEGEVDKTGLIITDTDGVPELELIADFVQAMLHRFEIDEPVEVRYVHSTSRPKLDGYGGGAMLIDRKSVMTFDVESWLPEAHAKISGFSVRWIGTHEAGAGLVYNKCRSWDPVKNPADLTEDNLFTSEAAETQPAPENLVWVREDLFEEEPVVAHLRSDDSVVQRFVDVRPWLMGAPADDLIDLAEFDWSPCEFADRAAYELELQADPGALALFSYLALNPVMPNGDQVGFALSFDGESVLSWLEHHRPGEYAALIGASEVDPSP